MNPRVTVGISFHDEERRLEMAIRSVLAQTFGDFELLLVDDGSTDRSLEIARRFLGDPRVRLSSDGERRHLAARLNEITRRARGDLIARMDADDIMHPERLSMQVAHMDREPECDAVGTWAALIADDDRAFAIIEAAGVSATKKLKLGQTPIAHATMMARARWLRDYPYDETLTRAEDRDLWCRVAAHARIDVLEDVLYVVHVDTRAPGFLSDYLRGQADLRRVLVRYGRAAPLRAIRLASASVLKSAAMIASHRLGASDKLVERRGRRPTGAEQRRVAEAIAASSRQPP